MGIVDDTGIICESTNDVDRVVRYDRSSKPILSKVDCCWGISLVFLELEGFLKTICSVHDIRCILN